MLATTQVALLVVSETEKLNYVGVWDTLVDQTLRSFRYSLPVFSKT